MICPGCKANSDYYETCRCNEITCPDCGKFTQNLTCLNCTLKGGIMSRILLATLVLLWLLAFAAVSAQAQTSTTSHTVGKTTFTTGTVDGKRYSATEQKVGRTTFKTERIGGETKRSTERKVGRTTFTSGD